MVIKNTLLTCILLWSGFIAFGQEEDQQEVPSYQTMYDDPYDIRNLYISFQPMYGDIGSLNIGGGFGVEATYYQNSLFDAYLAFRTTYGKKFDINRDAAIKNATNNNDYPIYYDVDFGGTYHLQDIMTESSSDVLLYSKSLRGTDWASTMANTTTISGKVRNIIGIRLGGILHSTTVNINSVLVHQDLTLYYSDGIPVINENMFSNLNTFTIYVGGSYSWIKNYAVEFSERWDPAGDDKIITPYFDFMFAASNKLDDLALPTEVVSTDPIEKLNVGFRGGLNVKYNRTLSWGYGLEAGLRPGVKKDGWFFMFKMSFPVYARKMHKKVESNEQRLLPKLKFFRRTKE